jgi:GH35 family endo-1,4-beta-xylanase
MPGDLKARLSTALLASALATDFGQITPENQVKFGALRPSPTTFNFAPADTLVDFALATGMAVHGHTLLWHMNLPAWRTSGSWTRDPLIDILRTHIHTVVGRYKGRVASWDVVNERIDENGELRNTIWRTVIGDDYLELAFSLGARGRSRRKALLQRLRCGRALTQVQCGLRRGSGPAREGRARPRGRSADASDPETLLPSRTTSSPHPSRSN